MLVEWGDGRFIAMLLIYGATGFVGQEMARAAVAQGLPVVVAGRHAEKVNALAKELGVEARVFGLDDAAGMDAAMREAKVVLHCAGPFFETAKPIADGCLRAGAHYLDITGEIPVYEILAARDGEAKARGVMLMPGVGFDVVPTDCLALHLKQRLPRATHLTLAFYLQGPAGIPPGTANTSVELIPYGNWLRVNGEMVRAPRGMVTRQIDFGQGVVEATRTTWGDLFMAYRSTGIPNIEEYFVIPKALRDQLAMVDRIRPIFKYKTVRKLFRKGVKAGSTAETRAKSRTLVWGQVTDDHGGKAEAREVGPEPGVDWTIETSLAVVRHIYAGEAKAGFWTPAQAYGADLVLEGKGVTREDV